ncbi:VOC family protein [Longimicrobium sp.]|uniref:VOC family protein n=1 Tax=Longimicrobium sp. TaxID=2029185 RepID=UPI002BDA909F|nr:VOC family protein [Longimicrobium sp.]HSU12590.1 VOC family protein [Longimicrobium sp.]
MEKVTGIGGIFFKSADPKALGEWYARHLGIDVQPWGGAAFRWGAGSDDAPSGTTAWSLFSADTKHFAPSTAPFMLNYRVRDLDAMLAQLRAAGVAVDEKVDDSEYGRFGWVMDPEGNRIELWQPPEGS